MPIRVIDGATHLPLVGMKDLVPLTGNCRSWWYKKFSEYIPGTVTDLPLPIKVGARSIRFSLPEVENWLANRMAERKRGGNS